MADNYNLLDNFLEELHHAVHENSTEIHSFTAEEFVNHMLKQFDAESDSYILDQIAETKVPEYLDHITLGGLITFLGVTLESWFGTKVANWKDVPPDFKEKIATEAVEHVVVAFLISSGSISIDNLPDF